MIKKKISITLLSLFAVLLWDCEKDDICAEGVPTTPKLVIGFYDATNPTIQKDVVSLSVVEENKGKDSLLFTGKNTISLPLRTNAEKTVYLFTSNTVINERIVPLNSDRIEFNYSTKNIFVSRACGYKTLFTLTDSPNGAVLTEINNDGWIESIEVLQTNIIDETKTHIEMFF